MLPIVVIALTVARIAVMVSLRVVVPTLLTLLSLLFGPGLKKAAKAVGRAGVAADRGMHRATQRVLGNSSKKQKGADEMRVEVDPPARVQVSDAISNAQDEVSAALEEVAEEIEALRDKPKKKKRHREG